MLFRFQRQFAVALLLRTDTLWEKFLLKKHPGNLFSKKSKILTCLLQLIISVNLLQNLHGTSLESKNFSACHSAVTDYPSRVCKKPLHAAILSKTNTVHTLPFYLLKSHVFHQRLVLSSCLFPSGFAAESLYEMTFFPTGAKHPAILNLLDVMTCNQYHHHQ